VLRRLSALAAEMEALSRAAAGVARATALQPPRRSAPRAPLPRCASAAPGIAARVAPALSRRAAAGASASRRSPTPLAAPAAAPSAPAAAPALLDWLASRGLPPCAVAPGPAGGLVTTRAVAPGEVLLELPDSFAVTATDVAAHPRVARLAEGRGELVGLALWLMAEREAGDASEWCATTAIRVRLCTRKRRAPSWQRALRAHRVMPGAHALLARLLADASPLSSGRLSLRRCRARH
jgi:hypothetical protein